MSHRGNLTERLILIPLLLAERPHSQRELSENFDVDGITIRRNIDVLTSYYQILSEKRDREMYYFFGEGYKYKAPNFTPGELATLLLAQESIAATGISAFGTPFAGYGRMLLAKVRAALPPSLREYLDTLSSIFGTSTVPAKDYTQHAEKIDTLTKAAASCRRLRMRYHTLHSDAVKDRQFDPYAVYFDPDGATLKTIGHDHNSNDIKLFSIDRIQSLDETGETFIRPKDFNLQEYLTEYCFNGIHGEPMTVRLKAYDVTARVFAERKFHPSQHTLEHNPPSGSEPESITIEMRVARGRGLERFILSWIPQIEVMEPLELRRKITDSLKLGIEYHELN